MALLPGTRLGPYEVTAQIGAGGMGEVYRALDANLNRHVALKVLPEAFTFDADRLARFKREAQVLASLNHPNIAGIHGLETSGRTQALVLELVEGPTLADRIAEGPMPLEEALPVARQITDALEAAHEQGVVHRDLKPANIKVRADGTVKVLDFGLAKALDPAPAMALDATASPTITTPAMTRMGMILGTAAYMSPEQARGRAADKRSDVWAFGCVLYEMLAGRRAFDGEDVADTLAAVLRGEPDWTVLPPSLPSWLAVLVRRCLEKDRRRRVGDMSVVRFLLSDAETFSAPAGAGSTPSLRRRRLPAAAVAGMLAAMALVGVGAWLFGPGVPAPQIARFSFTLPQGQQLTNTTRHLVAISPDGARLVYVANNTLHLRSLSELETRAISGADVQSSPTFSPDGQSIAFYTTSGSSVKRVALTGGAPITVCQSKGMPYSLTWDPTGILLGQGGDGIVRCFPNGGTPEQLVTVQEGEEAHGPQMLPGGALLYTLARSADRATRWDKSEVIVQAPSSAERRTIVTGGSDARYVDTGHLLYTSGGVLFAVPFDPVAMTIAGGPVPVIEGVSRGLSGLTGASHFAFSRSGTLVYLPGPIGATSTERVVAVASREGIVTRLPGSAGPYVHVRSSPGGTRLAVGSDDGREAIVWVQDLHDSSAARRLTFAGRSRWPIWSPDGQRIAFQSDHEGDAGLFWQPADGSGAAQRLTTATQGEAHEPEAWSPDGKFILFSILKGSRYLLHVLSMADSEAKPFGVDSAEPTGAVFSPDGRWVAYHANPFTGPAPTPNRGVFVQPFPATGARYQAPKHTLDFQPVWSPSGKELFYVPSAASGVVAAVSVTTQPTFAFGTPVVIPARVTAGMVSVERRAFDVLPDGRFVGLVSPAVAGEGDALSDRSALAPGAANVEMRVVLNWFEELKARVPVP